MVGALVYMHTGVQCPQRLEDGGVPLELEFQAFVSSHVSAGI